MIAPRNFVVFGRYAGPDIWRFRDSVVIKSVLQKNDRIQIVGVDNSDSLVNTFICPDQITNLRADHLPDRFMSSFSCDSDLNFPDAASADAFIQQVILKQTNKQINEC